MCSNTNKTLFAIILFISANSLLLISQDSAYHPIANKRNVSNALIELPTLQIWVDSTNQVIAPAFIEEKPFKPLPIDFALGKTDYAYWFKFSLENNTNTSQNFWLNTNVFDSLTLVEPTNSSVQHRGLLVRYQQSEKEKFLSLEEHKYGFPIHLAAHSKPVFYLRIKNIVRFESSFDNIVLLQRTEQNITSTIWYLIFNMVLFGILAFLAFFSLFQFFQNKDLAYFFYFLYLTTCNIYMWWKFEKANSFINIFFTNSPEWYYYLETPTCLAIYISYLFFLIHFINAKKESPIFYKLLKGGTVVILLYLVLDRLLIQYIGYALSWQIYFVFRILLTIAAFMAFYLIFKSKAKLALYLLSGSIIVLIGNCITAYYSTTMTQHYWNSWDIPLIPIQIAILIEAFLFSMGLGYKSRLAERERTKMYQNWALEKKEKENQKKQKEQLTHWFSNISHEFRTPLTVILGVAARVSGNLQEKELISRNGQQLLTLVNQTLDLSKLKAAKMDLNWVQTDIIPYLKYICEPFDILAKNKQQTFSLQVPVEAFLMDIDKEKMRQIISNLLTNAIKFTHHKGSISVVVNRIEEKGKSYLQVQVSDNGKGIPKAFQQQIFEPYAQLPETEQGTGIGLALVKELTDLLGGTISLQSQATKGSCFTLSLPIHQFADKQLVIIAENGSSTPPIKCVKATPLYPSSKSALPVLLLVEDNEDILAYLQYLLNEQFNLICAKNGQEGLEKAMSVRPDLIISDVMMPKLNGFELCKKLKTKSITRNIPIILVTAKATEEDRLEALRLQADAYFTKPFNEKELLLRIQQLLQKKKIQPANSIPDFLTLPSTQMPLEREAMQFMQTLHEIIEANLSKENFRVKDLCEALSINHTSLNKRIKGITGKPTATYMRLYRLSIAKNLLETTDLSTSEIAWKIGIPEASNFSNMFKKVYGVRPRAWRKEDV